QAWMGVERHLGGRPTRSRLVLIAFHYGERRRVKPRFSHRVVDAVDAFPLHMEMRRPQAVGTGHHGSVTTVRTLPVESHGEQADLPVAKLDNVFGELGHRGAIVDADP